MRQIPNFLRRILHFARGFRSTVRDIGSKSIEAPAKPARALPTNVQSRLNNPNPPYLPKTNYSKKKKQSPLCTFRRLLNDPSADFRWLRRIRLYSKSFFSKGRVGSAKTFRESQSFSGTPRLKLKFAKRRGAQYSDAGSCVAARNLLLVCCLPFGPIRKKRRKKRRRHALCLAEIACKDFVLPGDRSRWPLAAFRECRADDVVSRRRLSVCDGWGRVFNLRDGYRRSGALRGPEDCLLFCSFIHSPPQLNPTPPPPFVFPPPPCLVVGLVWC